MWRVVRLLYRRTGRCPWRRSCLPRRTSANSCRRPGPPWRRSPRPPRQRWSRTSGGTKPALSLLWSRCNLRTRHTDGKNARDGQTINVIGDLVTSPIFGFGNCAKPTADYPVGDDEKNEVIARGPALFGESCDVVDDWGKIGGPLQLN